MDRDAEKVGAEDVGAKDVMIGFIFVGGMAGLALIVGIVAALT